MSFAADVLNYIWFRGLMPKSLIKSLQVKKKKKKMSVKYQKFVSQGFSGIYFRGTGETKV